MKIKVKITILLLVVLVGFSVPAGAALIDRGTGMIYDTESGLTWLQDADYCRTSGYDDDGRMNWDDAMVWANGLEYGGISDWRLPSSYNPDGSGPDGWDAPYNITYDVSGSEMGNLYYNVLDNIGYWDADGNEQSGHGLSNVGPYINLDKSSYPNNYHNYYWSGTEHHTVEESAWYFTFHDVGGNQNVHSKSNELYAWAIRDGDYGPSVTTTETYLTEYLTLGDTFTFDYWWEMGMEPADGNFDVLFFNGTEWETFGWDINFDGSSSEWETASFWVPEWARGEDVQIMFSLYDWGEVTDPTVYLRNVGTSSAPVPEPATVILLGVGLVGLAGASRKKLRRNILDDIF